MALGKLLIRQAGVWLLDEPFGALDPVFRTEFRADLHLLLERTGATMIIVTHDPIDASALGRRIGVLGDGRLQQIGSPDELRTRPGNRFVAFCLGRLSLIDGRVNRGDPSGRTFVSECGSVVVPLPDWLDSNLANRLGMATGGSLTLGIRPEAVAAVQADGSDATRPGVILAGWSVVAVEPAGSRWVLTAARGRTRIRVEWSSGSPPLVGSLADWFLPADHCVWFDGQTGRRIGDSEQPVG